MTKVVLNDLTNLNNTPTTVAKINGNNDKIEQGFENTLSRNGAAPNQMLAPIDMNGQRILNLPAPINANEPLRKADIDLATGAVGTQVAAAAASATAAAGSASAASSSATSASTSATNASASATAAATSATNANTSATNAQTYANNAATSAASAAALAGAAASAITFSPTGTISATNAQAAIAEVAAEAYQLSSTTTFGRSVVSAADAGAARNLLGISSPLTFDVAGGLTSITTNTTLAKSDQGKYLRVTADTVTTITLPASMLVADAGWYVVLKFDNQPSNTNRCGVSPNGQTWLFRNLSGTTSFLTPGYSETLMFLWTGNAFMIHVIQNAPKLYYSYIQSASGSATTFSTNWHAPSNSGSAAPTYNLAGLYDTLLPYMHSSLKYIGKYQLTNACYFPVQSTWQTLGLGAGLSTTNPDFGQEYETYAPGEDGRYKRFKEIIELDAATTVYPVMYGGAANALYVPNTLSYTVYWMGR